MNSLIWSQPGASVPNLAQASVYSHGACADPCPDPMLRKLMREAGATRYVYLASNPDPGSRVPK